MDETSINAGFDELLDRVGSLEILVNNGHFPLGADLTDVTGTEFQQLLGNATGYFLLARRFRNWSISQKKSASIIMLGSMYGVVGSYPETYEGLVPASPVAYHTLKGGIVQMTRHLAVYWAKQNIRVNCLSPGPFPGPQADSEMVKRLCQKSPMGRMGVPEELNGAIVFLASDASSYMTGQKNNCTIKFFRNAHSSHRTFLTESFHHFRISLWSWERSRTEAIHTDVLFCPVNSKMPSHLNDSPF
jgi:gluconate 5-dehydrogenase